MARLPIRPTLVLPLALAAACSPQNAQITSGDYLGFLAATNSLSVIKGDIPLGEDAFDGDGASRYDIYQTVDCREFETATTPQENEALRIDSPNRLRICDNDPNPGAQWPPQHETWLENTGYYVIGETLDPWRGEAIITSEGDIQVGFHHRLPGGEDFRFMFVIDPDFQPQDCVPDGNGGTELVPVDGDWVEGWSEGLGGASRYYLNAGSFMWDPVAAAENTGGANPPQWLLPNWWLGGYGAGRLGDDDLRIRTTRFAVPELYLAIEAAELTAGPTVQARDLFYCDVPDLPDCDARPADCESILAAAAECQSVVDDVSTISQRVGAELAMVGLEPVDGLPTSRPKVETNRWRPFATDDPSSLSRWVELHYNWVDFDTDPATLEPGDSVSGSFHLFLDAVDSSTRVVVRGNFDIPRLKRDIWTTDYLPPELVERNETELCGGAESPDYLY